MATSKKIPSWLQGEIDAVAAVNSAARDHDFAEMKIKAEGEAFWRRLREELELVATNLPDGLQGRFTHSDFAISRHEDHCRVAIACVSMCPKVSYADFWYCPGDTKVRCRTSLAGSELSLFLCVVEKSIKCVTESHAEPMTAEETAEFVSKPMIEFTKPALLSRALS